MWSGGHVILTLTMFLNLFFPDQWIFQTLYFEESLTGERLIPEIAHHMGFKQGDIARILVVSVSRFSSRTQTDHQYHRYPPAS